MNTINCLATVAMLCCLIGCDSGHDAQLEQAQRNFDAVVKGQQGALQWQLDQATAKQLFWKHYDDAPDVPTPAYDTFLRCHEEPPTHEANKRTCAVLQTRVAKQEAKAHEQAAKEKAAW